MSFSFSSAIDDLGDIETEHVGFQAIAGDIKVRLLPTPWPTAKLPPPTASLLAIASQRGILAAAGPHSLVIASTESVRARFLNKAAEASEAAAGDLRDFQAQATLQIPRLSHLAFSADESCLVVAAEEGGGLAVYDTNALLNAGKHAAFQMATNGVAVRQLLPNPGREQSHFFGVVLANGQLLLANLKEQRMVETRSGSPVFRENVSCACWSKLGKQVVVGLADGSAIQLDPSGAEKAIIPAPPQLSQLGDPASGQTPVTTIYWLETLDFLMIHTPINQPSANSLYTLAHRDKVTGNCTYARFALEPCLAFTEERVPSHHFIQRLLAWPPALDDTLILASTTSTDVGLLTRSSKSLNPDRTEADVANRYLTTAVAETRRPTLPMSVADSMSDTSPIGMALDLSTNELVGRPIPGDDEFEESRTPLPALYVLNNEGVLAAWWIVYNDSVRAGTMYPGLVAVGGGQASQQAAKTSQQTPVPQSAFGHSSFGAPASTPAPAAATPAQTPAFGQSTFGSKPAAPAFGSSTPMGPSTFGQPAKPAFGQASTPMGAGAGFGQVGGIGMNKGSVWGAPTGQSQTPSNTGGTTFGQASTPFGGNTSAASPFLNVAGKKLEEQNRPVSTGGGFSGFANKGGFGSLLGAGAAPNAGSPFSSQQPRPAPPAVSAEPSFGSTVTLLSNTGSSFGSGGTFGGASMFGTPSKPQSGASVFGKSAPQSREESMEEDTPIAKPAEERKEGGGLFGLGAGGFKLGSTFQGDGSAKDDAPKPANPAAGLFGSSFGSALGDAAKQQPATPVKKEPGTEEGLKLSDIPEAATTTPASPPKQHFAQETGGADTPLPPDFTKVTMKTEPLPDFLVGRPTAKPAEEQPIAGSPPVDVENGHFSEAAASPEGVDEVLPQDESEVWSEEDGEGLSEGSERGEAQERTREIPSTTPPTTKKDSFTPAGFPKATGAAAFAAPLQSQESPRSPSPVRGGKAGKSPLRAVTSPVRPTFNQQRPSSSFSQHLLSGPAPRISVPPTQPISRPTSRAPQTPAEPQYEDLEDSDSSRIQHILASDIVPTKELAEFIAHQDYAGRTDKQGIAGEIEKVYRDVNSMVDTAGLNARSLRAFVDGHSEVQMHGERGREDLEYEDGWCLEEVGDLGVLQGDLGEDLEAGALEDVRGIVEGLRAEGREVERVRIKAAELRRQISQRANPEQRGLVLAAPLPPETARQQAELREGVQRVQRLLAEAEEGMSLLRADLASLPASSDGARNVAQQWMPTVEAVTNTILKMTAMIEKKSGDIDVLESQIKRLPGGLASLDLNADYEDDLAGALRGSRLLAASTSSGSPYSTPKPAPRKSRMAANGDVLGMSGMLGTSKFRTPPTGRRGVASFSPSASALGRSIADLSGSARKRLGDVSAREVRVWNERVERRKGVLDALRGAVEERGVRVVVART